MGCGVSSHSEKSIQENHFESENMFRATTNRHKATQEETNKLPDKRPPEIIKPTQDDLKGDIEAGCFTCTNETKTTQGIADSTKEEETVKKDGVITQHMEKKKEKTIGEVKYLLKVFPIADKTLSTDFEYSDDLMRALVSLDSYIGHTFGEDVPLVFVEQFKADVFKLIPDSQVLELCCDVVIQAYRKDWKLCFSSNSVDVCLCLILNFTDVSEEISDIVANYPEFLETMKKILQEAVELLKKENTLKTDNALDNFLAIIHNLAMRDSCIGRLRSFDFTSALRPYLESSSSHHQLSTLSALAGIVNEKESEIINANRHIVQIHLNFLNKGLRKKHHRYSGWSCKELATVVRMLARNDANKRLLVELGALQALVKLAHIGDNGEKSESTAAIWALCFDAENRSRVVSEEALGVVDILVDLCQSNDKGVRKNCQGALWTLREDLRTSYVERYRAHADSEQKVQEPKKKKKGGKEKVKTGHIMISYQWSDQPTMKIITEKLKENNYKVWIDIEKMGGSTLEAMALAIEQAEVVLVCISQKYKNSPNCRAEAEYAFQTHKPIIPLKMERGYVPDGWLGIIIGTKLFYEFSPKYPFEDKMNQLLQAVANMYNQNTRKHQQPATPDKPHTVAPESHGRDDLDSGAPRPPGVTMTTTVTMETAERVRKWEADKVKDWVQKNNLTGCKMDNLTGGEIALLLCMRCEAPEFFYRTLHEMLHVDNLLTMSKIVWALKDLAVQK